MTATVLGYLLKEHKVLGDLPYAIIFQEHLQAICAGRVKAYYDADEQEVIVYTGPLRLPKKKQPVEEKPEEEEPLNEGEDRVYKNAAEM